MAIVAINILIMTVSGVTNILLPPCDMHEGTYWWEAREHMSPVNINVLTQLGENRTNLNLRLVLSWNVQNGAPKNYNRSPTSGVFTIIAHDTPVVS